MLGLCSPNVFAYLLEWINVVLGSYDTRWVWTSNCNDALDCYRIQRGFSYLLPPEPMGAHIGPPEAHTTGRTHPWVSRHSCRLLSSGLAFRC